MPASLQAMHELYRAGEQAVVCETESRHTLYLRSLYQFRWTEQPFLQRVCRVGGEMDVHTLFVRDYSSLYLGSKCRLKSYFEEAEKSVLTHRL